MVGGDQNDLDNWDPMKEDYEDKSFNSYSQGPGRNLPEDPQARKKFMNLYVRGVPSALNEQGLRNLFGKHGEVISCRIRSTPNYHTNLAFVMMASLDQCTQAIQSLNGHKIGNDRLNVEFAKSQEEKDKAKRENEEQDRLIRQLGSGRTVTTGNNTGLQINVHNQPTSDSEQRNSTAVQGNGVSPASSQGRGGYHNANRGGGGGRGGSPGAGYSRGGGSPGGGYSRGGGSHARVQNNNSVCNDIRQLNNADPHRQPGADMDRNMSGYMSDTAHNRGKPRYNNNSSRPGDRGDSLSPRTQSTPATEGLKSCEECGKPGSGYKCGGCSVYYCSTDCQTKNWGRHRTICMRQNSPKSLSRTSPNTQIPPNPATGANAVPVGSSLGVTAKVNTRLETIPEPVNSEIMPQQAHGNRSSQNGVSLSLPLNQALKVRLVEFRSPERFFVQLADGSDVQRLESTLNQPDMSSAIQIVSPQPGDLLAVKLANGIWHRGLVISINAGQFLLYLVDIGQKHLSRFLSPLPESLVGIPFQAIECSLYGLLPYMGDKWTDFSVQVSTKLGLTAGLIYSITCADNSDGNKVMFSLPDDGGDLGDALVNATGALIDPQSKYKVLDSAHRYATIGESLGVIPEPSSIEGVDSFYAQIGGIKNLNSYISQFGELEVAATEYGQQMTATPNFSQRARPVAGDFVLCFYEGNWSRAEIYGANESKMALGFIDYGNVHLSGYDHVMPLPRHLSHLPAISAKVHLQGLTDSPDEAKKLQSAALLKELIGSGAPVAAIVKDINLDTISLELTAADGRNINEVILQSSLAVPCTTLLPESFTLRAPHSTVPALPAASSASAAAASSMASSVAAAPPPSPINHVQNLNKAKQTSSPSLAVNVQPPHNQRRPAQSPNQAQQQLTSPRGNVSRSPAGSNRSPSGNNNMSRVNGQTSQKAGSAPMRTPPQKAAPMRTPPQQAAPKVTSVELPLTTGQTYTVRLRKLDQTSTFCVNWPNDIPPRCIEQVTKTLHEIYSGPNVPEFRKPDNGDYVVFQHVPGEFRRGYIMKVSSANEIVLVRHLDFEGETNKVKFAMIRPMIPSVAKFPCQAHPVCQLEGITEPEAKNSLLKPYMQLALQMKVLSYKDGVYTVQMSLDGEPLKTGRKVWMAGTDIPYVSLPSGEEFLGNIVDAISPVDMHVTPLVIKDIQECLQVVGTQGAKVEKENPLSQLSPGEVVMVFCSAFGEWDRGIVLQVNGEHVTIKSADYGSVYTESMRHTRALTADAARLPLRAVQICLSGVTGAITDSACQYVKSLVQKQVKVKTTGLNEGKAICILTTTEGENVSNAVKSLVPANGRQVPPTAGIQHSAAAPPPLSSVEVAAGTPPLTAATSQQPTVTQSTAEHDPIARLEMTLATLLKEVSALRAEKSQLLANEK